MSELNLETPLIYPPHWIDRSWLRRGSLSRTAACWILTLSAVFLILKSKAASYYNSTVPLHQGHDGEIIHSHHPKVSAADYNQLDVAAGE